MLIISFAMQMTLSFKSEIDQIKIEFEKKKQRNQLKTKIKTVHSNYEINFNYLATLLGLNSFDQLNSKLNLLYRASEHNFDSNKFHQLCDGKGPTLVIVRSTTKRLFGGYSTKSWFSYDGYSSAPGSFLFSLDKQTKHEIYKNEENAIFGNLEMADTAPHLVFLVMIYIYQIVVIMATVNQTSGLPMLLIINIKGLRNQTTPII